MVGVGILERRNVYLAAGRGLTVALVAILPLSGPCLPPRGRA